MEKLARRWKLTDGAAVVPLRALPIAHGSNPDFKRRCRNPETLVHRSLFSPHLTTPFNFSPPNEESMQSGKLGGSGGRVRRGAAGRDGGQESVPRPAPLDVMLLNSTRLPRAANLDNSSHFQSSTAGRLKRQLSKRLLAPNSLWLLTTQ